MKQCNICSMPCHISYVFTNLCSQAIVKLLCLTVQAYHTADFFKKTDLSLLEYLVECITDFSFAW